VIYIGTNEVATITKHGVADVALFNPKDFSLLIGLVDNVIGQGKLLTVFVWECQNRRICVRGYRTVSLPLVDTFLLRLPDSMRSLIPITEAMKEPEKFPRVLSWCMLFVATLFTGFGVMGYMAYGSDIQTVVIVNLPQDDKFVQAVQFLYTVAIILR
jgi:proton-coupled amino acid transporter